MRTTGRHDPCVGLRAAPVVEAMIACVLADAFLRHRGQTGGGAFQPGSASGPQVEPARTPPAAAANLPGLTRVRSRVIGAVLRALSQKLRR